MFRTFCTMFRTGLSTFSANVPNVFVFHHATGVNPSFGVPTEDSGVFQFLQKLFDALFRLTNETRELRCAHGLAIHRERPVRVAFMHDAHHLRPQAARAQGAALQGCILTPVGRVKLESWSLH
jgi:hypothetical protein